MNIFLAPRFTFCAFIPLFFFISASAQTSGLPDSSVVTSTTISTDSGSSASIGNRESIATPAREIHYTQLAIVGTGLVGGMAAIHIYQQNGWWKNNRRPFHFQEDLRYSRGVDKIGHFMGASTLSFVISKSIETSNISEEASLLIGCSGGLLFQTFLEVEDGYSTWGFDRVDFASDLGGAAYPILQYYVPFMKNFNLKYSYHPVNMNKPGTPDFPGQKRLIMDDYEGQTLWLTVKTHNLLPQPLKSYWPEWLGIAVGYGVRDVDTKHDYGVVFIAPDINLGEIIPRDTWFLRTLGDALDHFHLPLPAVQCSPRTVWYGLYF